MTIAKNIKKLRQEKNLTQDQLAERLYVTRQTVSNWERGTSNPDLDQLEAIAAALEVDTMTLLYGPQPASRPGRCRIVLAVSLILAAVVFWIIRSHIGPELEWRFKRGDMGYYWLTLVVQPIFVMIGTTGATGLASLRWDISLKKRGKRVCLAVFILLLVLLLLSLAVLTLREYLPYWLFKFYFKIWIVHDPEKIQTVIAVLAGLLLFFAVNPPWRKIDQSKE